jgi:2'-5' RNA ligase
MKEEKPKLKRPAFLSRNKDQNDEQNAKTLRKRQVEHVRGNWSMLVYIPVILDKNAVKEWSKRTPAVIPIQEDTLPTHISLSRNIYCHVHHIDRIFELLQEEFQDEEAFTIRFTNLNCYSNEDKSRYFVAVDSESDDLHRLSRKVDKVLERFRFPLFYENPVFHVSFAWNLEEIDLQCTDIEPFEWYVDSIKCKIGNIYKAFDLKKICGIPNAQK